MMVAQGRGWWEGKMGKGGELLGERGQNKWQISLERGWDWWW